MNAHVKPPLPPISRHHEKPEDCVRVVQPGAVKHDGGKARYGLIAPEFLHALAWVLTFGARKYSAGNWAKGMAWSRPYDALLRHLNAWAGGEKADEETGKSHLWHAACCLMFLIVYEVRGIGYDDRVESGLMKAPE